MKKYFLFLLILVVSMSCSTLSQKQNTTSAIQEKPKLVIGIVVDQMRYDYLTRFYDRYDEGGFKRLLNEGFNCKNNHFNYVPTYTAPGHASVYTGTSPENNGIIGNNWYDKFEGKMIYNASDDSVSPVGTTSDDGKMSPHRMLTTTVTDELELHTQGRAKVIGVSIKDRGAILPAGHAADAAYWYEGGDAGNFISSSFYMNSLPSWAQSFNNSKRSEQYLREWNTLYPLSTYTASGNDLNDYERPPKGKTTATFPYDLRSLSKTNDGYSIIKATPYGNSIVADFAIAAMVNEEMGKDEITDFLAVSFSSTDYVGHQYGVNSVELEDTYLRLDRDIKRLLETADAQVGAGNYTVFLTADHGAVNVPAYLQSRKVNAGYFDSKKLKKYLNGYLTLITGESSLVKNVSNQQIFLDYDRLSKSKLSSVTIQNHIKNTLLGYSKIDKVFTRETLMNSQFTSGTGALVQQGFHQKRSGDVVYILEPGVISYSKTGSTHGSSQSYDTHVPLLFYGAGIRSGSTVERTHIIDIAPTISSLLGISFPNGATGNPIKAVLR